MLDCCWIELLVDAVAFFVQSGRLKNNEGTGQLNVHNWLVLSDRSLEVRQNCGICCKNSNR